MLTTFAAIATIIGTVIGIIVFVIQISKNFQRGKQHQKKANDIPKGEIQQQTPLKLEDTAPIPCPFGSVLIHTNSKKNAIAVSFNWLQADKYRENLLAIYVFLLIPPLLILLMWLSSKGMWGYARIVFLAFYFPIFCYSILRAYGSEYRRPFERAPFLTFLAGIILPFSINSVIFWFLFKPVFQLLQTIYLNHVFIGISLIFFLGSIIEAMNHKSWCKVESILNKDGLIFSIKWRDKQYWYLKYYLDGIEGFDFELKEGNSSQLFFIFNGTRISFNWAFGRNVDIPSDVAAWIKDRLYDTFDKLTN